MTPFTLIFRTPIGEVQATGSYTPSSASGHPNDPDNLEEVEIDSCVLLGGEEEIDLPTDSLGFRDRLGRWTSLYDSILEALRNGEHE